MAQLAALSQQNEALLQDIEKIKPVEKAKTKAQLEEEDRLRAVADPLAHAGLANPIGTPRIKARVLEPGELLVRATEKDIKWPSPEESPPFYERPPYPAPLQGDGDAEAIAAKRDPNPLHVVHVTAEMAPIAKVGGLGDVVTGLARAHLLQGHTVEVILPYYSSIEGKVENLEFVMDFAVSKGKETEWDGVREVRLDQFMTSMYTGVIGGCDVILLRPSPKERSNLFVGGKIYGGSYNELEAYLYFCRASLECLKVTGRDPNVIHVHEWQCSAVAMLYWDLYHAEGMLKNAKVMLTIHNMDNTGECRQEEFIATGVSGVEFNTLEKAMDERTIGHNPERLCLLKGAIVYSNYVTTVSPTYAKDALGGGGGFLNKTLAKSRMKFSGVLNGVDEQIWDARLDPFLPCSFKPGQMEGKALCKRYLQEGLGMDVNPDKPLVVCVSRLVPQKGTPLIMHAISHAKDQGGQFVLLGSGHSDPPFKQAGETVYKRDNDVKLLIFYSDALSHLLYAAADFVLVPSMFEPCGLTQMIAMEYGALPIVRKTGGLADTVFDLDDGAKPYDERNGFVFEGADNHAIQECMNRAFDLFKHRRQDLRLIQERVMKTDNTWEKAGKEYVRLYRAMQR
jgi:starch synthase